MHIIELKWKEFKMERKDFLEYTASYSGMDGKGINAEYWFNGIK